MQGEHKGSLRLTQVRSEVHRQLLDRRAVVLLDLAEQLHVALRHEVDRNTLAPVTATTTNTVQVVLLVRGQVVVDDDIHVVHVDTAGHEVRRHEHTRAAALEHGHHLLALALRHLGVHRRHGVVVAVQLLSDPVDLAARVHEDHGLRNRHGLVQVHQRVQLVLLLDGDEELLDTLQRQAVALHQNARGVAHELLGDVEHLLRHRGREQRHLDVLGQELEDVVNLLREALGEHLVGLVQDQNAQRVGAKRTTLDQVRNTAGGADGDDHASSELLDVVLHERATDERLAERRRVVATGQVQANLGDDVVRLDRKLAGGREHEALHAAVAEVQALQQANREGTGLAGTGLRLRNDVTAADERGDGTLLDGGRLLKTVRVDTAKQRLVQRHVVERRDDTDVSLVVFERVVVLRLNFLGHGCQKWGKIG